MKQAIMFGVIVIGSVVVWRLGSRLSADAVGLAVGVLLGVLASIPASLLILASSRRPAAPAEDERWSAPQERMPLYQPPVIILAGQGGGAGRAAATACAVTRLCAPAAWLVATCQRAPVQDRRRRRALAEVGMVHCA